MLHFIFSNWFFGCCSQVSNFLPTQFSDQCLRMYVKEKEMMAEAEKAFDAYCQRKNMKKQMVSVYLLLHGLVGGKLKYWQLSARLQ